MSKLHSLSLPLVQKIATTEEAANLMEKISSFLTSLYTISQRGIKERIQTIFSPNWAEMILGQMRDLNIDLTNQQQVNNFFTILSKDLSSLETLSLTLAFAPTAGTLQRISQVVKKAFGLEVVIEVTIKPEIIGGAIIVFAGRYMDFSLKKQLDILFEVKKEEILKLLN